jgi:hypothetical protein
MADSDESIDDEVLKYVSKLMDNITDDDYWASRQWLRERSLHDNELFKHILVVMLYNQKSAEGKAELLKQMLRRRDNISDN